MQISNTGDVLLSSDFELYSIEELEQIGEFTWHIADHFPKNSTVTVFGASGVGKSFLCLDMAMSIANGVPYLNKWGTKQGNVLYLCSEGGYGVKGRIAAWNKWRSLKPTKNINFSVTSHDLQNRAEVERLLRKTKEKFKTIDAVFVDTLSRNFGSGDTDRNHDMRLYLQNVDYIREQTGATVVNVHHTGNSDDRRERGAKSLRDYCDTSICVFAEKGTAAIGVSCEKQKDSAPFDTYSLAKVTIGSSLALKWQPAKTK